MGTPIGPGQSVDDFLNRRRNELLKTAPTSADSSRIGQGMTMPQDSTDPNMRSGVEEEESFLGDVKDTFNRVKDFTSNLLPKPNDSERVEQINQFAEDDTFLLGLMSPGGAGLGSAAGKAGVLRKTLSSRLKGAKLVDMLPQIQDEVAAMGDEIYDVGVNMWKSNLGGLNPGEFGRALAKIPAEKLATLRAGMIEGLVENIANMPRLTKAAQRNLLSPAGRAMLKETLAELPEEAFEKLMAAIEKGKFQEVRDWTLRIAAIYPLLRFGKDPILDFLGFK